VPVAEIPFTRYDANVIQNSIARGYVCVSCSPVAILIPNLVRPSELSHAICIGVATSIALELLRSIFQLIRFLIHKPCLPLD
jgi:hypothetical protein